MKVGIERLQKFLLESKLLTEKQFEKSLQESKKSDSDVRDVLVSHGLISMEDLVKVEAHILGIPFINLEKEKINPETLRVIPEAIARVHNIVAFRKKGNTLEVAMLDPEDLRTIEFIQKTNPSLKISASMTTEASIRNEETTLISRFIL